MKKIWYFLRDHVRDDFNKKQYGAIAIFLVICLSLNYTFYFEDNYLEAITGYPKFFAYLLFYSVPYFFSVYIFAFFKILHFKNPVLLKFFTIPGYPG